MNWLRGIEGVSRRQRIYIHIHFTRDKFKYIRITFESLQHLSLQAEITMKFWYIEIGNLNIGSAERLWSHTADFHAIVKSWLPNAKNSLAHFWFIT